MAPERITLRSSAFDAGTAIPKRHAYGGEGDNLSPELGWSGVPEATQEFALICDDPDAPSPQPWVHWVIYKIPRDARGLAEGVPARARLDSPRGALQGKNSWKEIGWGGPFPPPGHGTHHYHFKLYALDAPLALDAGATKAELVRAMQGHVIARGELGGTYRR